MKQYVVDAFTDHVFGGNPAAVCIMEEWIDDELMQKIAIENSLAETAFAVKDGKIYKLRWFTPGGEIDLCGHATLATSFVLMNFYERTSTAIRFNTMSGELMVKRAGKMFEMDFPVYEMKEFPVTQELTDAIGMEPSEAWIGRDLVAILPSGEDVLKYTPNMDKVLKLPGLDLHTTARGTETDCVSRSYGPKVKVPEDPVCGSGHCHIAPLWAEKLGKKEIVAYQASARGGMLYCKLEGERVKISGQAVLYSESDIRW